MDVNFSSADRKQLLLELWMLWARPSQRRISTWWCGNTHWREKCVRKGGLRNWTSFKSHSDGNIGIGWPQFTLMWRLAEERRQVGWLTTSDTIHVHVHVHVCVNSNTTEPEIFARRKFSPFCHPFSLIGKNFYPWIISLVLMTIWQHFLCWWK